MNWVVNTAVLAGVGALRQLDFGGALEWYSAAVRAPISSLASSLSCVASSLLYHIFSRLSPPRHYPVSLLLFSLLSKHVALRCRWRRTN